MTAMDAVTRAMIIELERLHALVREAYWEGWMKRQFYDGYDGPLPTAESAWRKSVVKKELDL